MRVHIQRLHGGRKEPVYLGDSSEYLLKSKKAKRRRPSSIYKALDSESSMSPFQNTFRKKSNSPFEFIHQHYQDIIEANEVIDKVAAIRGFYRGNRFHYPQLNTNPGSYYVAPGYIGKPFVPPFAQFQPSITDTKFPSFAGAFGTDSRGDKKEELAGFRAKVCENCGDVYIEAQYDEGESGTDPKIAAEHGHVCLCPLKSLSADEMGRRIASLAAKLTWVPWALKKEVKGWTGQDTFLVAFKIPFDKVKTEDIVDIFVSPRDVTNYGRNNNNHADGDYEELLNGWALQVREKGSITLSDNDLVDFLIMARNRTSGYFRIHFNAIKENPNSNSEVYCIFINNRPLHAPVAQQQTLGKN
jgi:hypothetical protein